VTDEIVMDENRDGRKLGAANIVSIHALRVLRALRDGALPVIAGFQGRTPSGDMTTLGRGGTAVAWPDQNSVAEAFSDLLDRVREA